MKKSVFLLLFLGFFSQAQNVHYTLSMENPEWHYLHVKMDISQISNSSYYDIKMASWAPGSYLIREFAKNVENFRASNGNKPLKFKKINKNTWRVFNTNSAFSVEYDVYAFELSVRTSFLDDSHANINGTSVFMYLPNGTQKKSTLEIKSYKNWHTTTALPLVSGKKNVYSAENIDVLFDSPIEIGTHKVHTFMVSEIPHEIAMYGSNFAYDTTKILSDLAKIAIAGKKVFGENPCKNYSYIVHNLAGRGGGGLEHLNSTVLQINKLSYQTELGYFNFLSLAAHEYFHLWNVKRLRPESLGPFDYDNENYTTSLWISEGGTSFYQLDLLLKAKLITPEFYLNQMALEIFKLENTPGKSYQSATESSFDTWIKLYRPNENSYNSTISYYGKGTILFMLLNVKIIEATQGKKNIDDVMKFMYDHYYKKLKRGFKEEEFQKAIEEITGISFQLFYDDYVFGTKTIDYQSFFNPLGIKLESFEIDQNGFIGTSLGADEAGKIRIKQILRDSPAWISGLNVNDEILKINEAIFPNFNEADLYIKNTLKIGEKVNIEIVREGTVRKFEVNVIKNPTLGYRLLWDRTQSDKLKLAKKWLERD